MTQQTLGTERLILRPLKRSDAGLIALYTGDARVAKMTTSIPHPLPPGSTETFIDGVLSGTRPETVWAIDHKGSTAEELIGLIGLGRSGALGYWLGAPFWHTGFATEAVEAVEAVVAHAQPAHQRLRAEVFQDNLPSARVLTKAGFSYIGDGESYCVARGARVPVWRYELAATG